MLCVLLTSQPWLSVSLHSFVQSLGRLIPWGIPAFIWVLCPSVSVTLLRKSLSILHTIFRRREKTAWMHADLVPWCSIAIESSAGVNMSHSSFLPSNCLRMISFMMRMNRSATPFDRGWYGVDNLWSMRNFSFMSLLSQLRNSVPWLLWSLDDLRKSNATKDLEQSSRCCLCLLVGQRFQEQKSCANVYRD